jgi:hypothetical protein
VPGAADHGDGRDGDQGAEPGEPPPPAMRGGERARGIGADRVA